MDVTAVKNQIKTGNISDFYIFTGPEWTVQKVYIEQLAKKHGVAVNCVDSVSSIYPKLKNKSFVNTKYCYTVLNDNEFVTTEKLQEQIDNGILGDNMLVLRLTDIDKRTKFYKKYADRIVDFEQMTEQILIKYIQKQIDLSNKNCQMLIDICEHDYGRILLEIDKIKRYVDAKQ